MPKFADARCHTTFCMWIYISISVFSNCQWISSIFTQETENETMKKKKKTVMGKKVETTKRNNIHKAPKLMIYQWDSLLKVIILYLACGIYCSRKHLVHEYEKTTVLTQHIVYSLMTFICWLAEKILPYKMRYNNNTNDDLYAISIKPKIYDVKIDILKRWQIYEQLKVSRKSWNPHINAVPVLLCGGQSTLHNVILNENDGKRIDSDVIIERIDWMCALLMLECAIEWTNERVNEWN